MNNEFHHKLGAYTQNILYIRNYCETLYNVSQYFFFMKFFYLCYFLIIQHFSNRFHFVIEMSS